MGSTPAILPFTNNFTNSNGDTGQANNTLSDVAKVRGVAQTSAIHSAEECLLKPFGETE